MAGKSAIQVRDPLDLWKLKLDDEENMPRINSRIIIILKSGVIP
jgi:hypothetical protein